MSLIPPGRIDHIGIAVRDLNLARTTYESILGAELSGCEVVEQQGAEQEQGQIAPVQIQVQGKLPSRLR